jgi:hypothetical protein
MSSAPLHNPETTLAGTLRQAAQAIRSERVTLRELLEIIGEQGMLVFCIILTIPFLLPVSIPGVSTVFGIVMVLIGIGVALNRVPWLPRRLMESSIAAAHLIPALERGARVFVRLDRLIRPRLLILTHSATVNRLNGFALTGAAVLLMAPLGAIPLTNTLPAIAILCLAAGMLQRDGVFVVVGYAATGVTIVYFGLLFGGALMAGQGIASIISS